MWYHSFELIVWNKSIAKIMHFCILYNIFKEQIISYHLIIIMLITIIIFFCCHYVEIISFWNSHCTEYDPYLVKYLIQVTWMELLLADLIKWNVVIYIYRTKHFWKLDINILDDTFTQHYIQFKVLTYIYYSQSWYVCWL